MLIREVKPLLLVSLSLRVDVHGSGMHYPNPLYMTTPFVSYNFRLPDEQTSDNTNHEGIDHMQLEF